MSDLWLSARGFANLTWTLMQILLHRRRRGVRVQERSWSIRTILCSLVQQSAHFADRPNIVQMHRFDPSWPQHGLHLGSTSANKAPTSGPSSGPTSRPTWLQLRPNLGSSLGAGGTHREAIRIQMQGTTNARKPTRIPAKSLYKESVVPI